MQSQVSGIFPPLVEEVDRPNRSGDAWNQIWQAIDEQDPENGMLTLWFVNLEKGEDFATSAERRRAKVLRFAQPNPDHNPLNDHALLDAQEELLGAGLGAYSALILLYPSFLGSEFYDLLDTLDELSNRPRVIIIDRSAWPVTDQVLLVKSEEDVQVLEVVE
jgi:hypothetical protein